MSRLKKTTEAELLAPLSIELKSAWIKLKKYSLTLGDQKIYASGKAIMFSKKHCFFFVRPRKTFLEVVIFLPEPHHQKDFKSITAVSKKKFAHTFKLIHEDQVEGVLTTAIEKAYLV